jgi:hypothetical protein
MFDLSRDDDDAFIILALCFLVSFIVFLILSQWKVLKCILCKAFSTSLSSNSNSNSTEPPINWIEGQFHDESIQESKVVTWNYL